MKKYLLFLCLAAGCMTAQAAAPKRKMLEQGKTWEYVHHHLESLSEPGSDGKKYAERTWMSYYCLNGDTIIDGRQYMKMYRSDWYNPEEIYYGVFREDEEGIVYQFDRYGDKRDTKRYDPNMDYGLGGPADNVVTETIKVNGELIHRYRYQYIQTSGELITTDISVEGVGYKRYGLLTPYGILTTRGEDEICDYEELNSVYGSGFWFKASDFDAPKEIELADGEQELINSNNDFAFNLFRKVRGDKSKVLSPLSITYALGMLNNGAEGQTLKEINQTLGFGEAGADAINAFCQKMLKESNDLDPKTKALIANTIFVNEGLGYRLQDGFIDKVNTYYDAQPQNRDFNDGETMDVINQWASDHTMGMIPKVLDENTFNPSSISYLLNALYFKGTWSSPFSKEMTQSEPFGGGPDVPMMQKQDAEFVYAENDLYQAVVLPYGNGAYRMTVFLPREDKTVGEVLESLDGNNWQLPYSTIEVDLKLPRFETDTQQDLVKVMSDLGMPTAFTGAAEFPFFCNVPCYITNMFQVAKIKLDEEGTEAAAVTVLEAGEAMPEEPKQFHANRPFLYVISEQSTGTIFFIGQYTGGVTADVRTGIAATKTEPKTVRNSQIFNLSGQRLSKAPARGLYIENGKVRIR